MKRHTRNLRTGGAQASLYQERVWRESTTPCRRLSNARCGS